MKNKSYLRFLLSLFLLGSSCHITATEIVEYTVEVSQSYLISPPFTKNEASSYTTATTIIPIQAPTIQWPDIKCRYRFSLFHYQQTINKLLHQNRDLWLSVTRTTVSEKYLTRSYNADNAEPPFSL